MKKGFRILFETYDLNEPESIIDRAIIIEDHITKPITCLDFSLEHDKQIELIQRTMDHIISEKAKLLNQDQGSCPKCGGKIIKLGTHTSTFHDVFTDHDVKIQRLRCISCNYEPASTVRTLLQGTLSGALAKIQSELGSSYTYRDSEEIMQKFSTKERTINNHNRVKEVTHAVGNTLSIVSHTENQLLKMEEAKELIVNVDGGHVKTTEGQRSIEALTSVIYRPESLLTNTTGTRNHLASKSCAASVKDDNQAEIINNTILAAIRQGLTPNTKITALCDGAANCWSIVEALRPLCSGMTCILDWFHISMKMQNISLPEKLKIKFLRVKWHLWRGNTEAAMLRIQQLISSAKSSKSIDKLEKFKTYIQNNLGRIVNYRERKLKGMIFTSNLAESTVESLINQRCKGQQHMRWSREGLNPILQLRATIHSDDWDNKWRTVILNSVL
jgi:hypothetical protein